MALTWKAFVEWDGTAALNLAPNPSLETNITGWTARGTPTTHAQSATQAKYGTKSIRVVSDSSGDGTRPSASVDASTIYTVSVWVFIVSGTWDMDIGDDVGTLSSNTSLGAANSTWRRITKTVTTNGGAGTLFVFLEAAGVGEAYFDGLQIEEGSVATPYYDGEIGDESDNLMEVAISRGRKHLVRNANGFEPAGVGEAVLTLRNGDGRYDPLNTNSPLYPAVEPGKVVRLWISDGTEYAMFTGHIFDVKPIGSQQSKRVQIVVRDGWQWLKDVKVRVAAQTKVRTDTAIHAIRSAAAYPFAHDIYQGVDRIPYWYAGDKDAASEIQSVVDSEFGLVWISGDGTLRFRRRPYQWLLSATHTLTGANINELSFAQPWEVVRNVIQVRVYPTEIRAKQILWRLSSPVKVRPGKTVTLRAKYNLQTNQDQTGLALNVQVGALDIETPVPSTDWRGGSDPGSTAPGSGDDLTNKLTVTATNQGEEARIQITNNGTRTAFVNYMQIRGRLIIKNNVVTVEQDESGSDAERTFVLDVPWQQSIDKAALYAEYLARYMKDPRAAPTARTNKAGLAMQCAELFTGYQFNISSLGLSNKLYRLCGVEHRWAAQSPNILDTRFFLERKDESEYITLDTYELGDPEGLAY